MLTYADPRLLADAARLSARDAEGGGCRGGGLGGKGMGNVGALGSPLGVRAAVRSDAMAAVRSDVC
jgi:hypothetical protein